MNQTTGQFAQKTETKRKNPISCKPDKDFSETTNSPFSQILHLQRTVGNRVVTGLLRSGVIQAKLKIGQPNDQYEQEADRVADQVMSMEDRSLVQQESTCPECTEKKEIQSKPLAEQITPLVHRKMDEEEDLQAKPIVQRQESEKENEDAQTKALQRQIDSEEEEENAQTKLQRQEEKPEEEEVQAQLKAAPGGIPEVTPEVGANINSMKGGGQPLSESPRSFFEPRFGVDFSQVRVHTDSKAAQTAQSINAKAFTTGKDIVFNSGQYSPGTSSGKRLLAHELTHVVQQTNSNSFQPGQAPCREKNEGRQTPNKNGMMISSKSILTASAFLQRLVRPDRVINCPNNPLSADIRASSLLANAINLIRSARSMRRTNPGHPDVVAVGTALATAFNLNPADNNTWNLGPPYVRLPVILMRIEIAKKYFDSVVFRLECCSVGGTCGLQCGTCTTNAEAFTCLGYTTHIGLCPLFWTRSLDQRGRILVHEVFHITFGFIGDRNQPDAHNAHCYAQFVALLNGFDSPPGFRC